MEGHSIQGKRQVVVMDSVLCTLCLYPSTQPHLLLPSPRSRFAVTAPCLLFCERSKHILLRELEGQAASALGPTPSNSNGPCACPSTSSACRLQITYFRSPATANKQGSFTLSPTLLDFSLWHWYCLILCHTSVIFLSH